MAPVRLPRFGLLSLAFRSWPWLLLLLALVGVRLSKGAPLADLYALLSRPFWPGPAQSEWLLSAQKSGDRLRLEQLERENRRLRGLLGLSGSDPRGALPAAVISRDPAGWWQQLLIGRGSLGGVRAGDAVLAPGGLIGRVSSVTPTTASVRLLTDPGSRVGVWLGRGRHSGLLSGIGTARPVMRFLEKDPDARPGDVVFTSPASTLVPPNLPVGVIQSLDEAADPAPEALVQLSAPVDAVDWVQVLRP
ncbi:MAG: rod shape-determining protein MreC [Cyanobacteriota bacterium]|nr:rod shape-determining protein MreC [Cyanobacteriota bacterium]